MTVNASPVRFEVSLNPKINFVNCRNVFNRLFRVNYTIETSSNNRSPETSIFFIFCRLNLSTLALCGDITGSNLSSSFYPCSCNVDVSVLRHQRLKHELASIEVSAFKSSKLSVLSGIFIGFQHAADTFLVGPWGRRRLLDHYSSTHMTLTVGRLRFYGIY